MWLSADHRDESVHYSNRSMHVRRFSRYCVVRVLLGGMVMECGESHVLNVYSESQNPQYVGASRFSWHILPFGGTNIWFTNRNKFKYTKAYILV